MVYALLPTFGPLVHMRPSLDAILLVMAAKASGVRPSTRKSARQGRDGRRQIYSRKESNQLFSALLELVPEMPVRLI